MATSKTRSKTRKKTKPPKDAPAVEMVIAPEVWDSIQQFRARSDHFVSEIGRIEIRKAAMIDEITGMNNNANAMLRQEGTRLGIPDGTPWRVTPDGKVDLDPEA